MALFARFKGFPQRGDLGYIGAAVHVQSNRCAVASENLPPDEKAARRKRMLIGLGLFAVSAFMYVSFIVKTAIKGP